MIRAALATLAAIAAVGCSSSDSFDGTAVRVKLMYGSELMLDSVDVALAGKHETGPIAPELLLVVPDALAGTPVTLAVAGEHGTERRAFASGQITPVLGQIVPLSLTLAACTPGCDGDKLVTCTAEPGTCPLGCVAATAGAAARCEGPTPSNGVPATLVGGVAADVILSADATFDTDTGAITGGVQRDMGVGVDVSTGIAYADLAPLDGTPAGDRLGVFAFRNLTVPNGVTIRFTGAHAAVLLVAQTATLGGVVDVQANLEAPGAGGFAGGRATTPATGCGPGLPGTHTGMLDSGGSGGAGGSIGGLGDNVDDGAGGKVMGGAAPAACLPDDLEPLLGGSGGGAGAPGGSASGAAGGGGGGAIQITALDTLSVDGLVLAGGGGGGAPVMSTNDYGGGGGGGGGGAILLEAETVNITGDLIAGGGGGGGGGASAGAGSNAGVSLAPASGGAPGPNGSAGGDGGAGSSPPDGGIPATTDGGGGGGGYGRIVLRANPTKLTYSANKTSPTAKTPGPHP